MAMLQEALSKDLESGSTAIIILIADGHILTANIGDSKAIMCSEDPHHSSEGFQLSFEGHFQYCSI